MSLWHGPTLAGGAFAGGSGARRGHSHRCEAARSGSHRKATLSFASQTFQGTPGGPRRAGGMGKRWTYHQVESSTLIEHKRYACKGRPTPHSPLKAIAWQIQARVRPAQEAMEHHKQVRACFVLGTNISTSELCDAEVIVAYKGQSCVEGGFRFLKAPLFFVSSL